MSIDTLPTEASEREQSSLLDLPIPLRDGSTATVANLLERWHASIYAEHMREHQALRYPRQAYDREAKLADLGPDVSPTGHQLETVWQAIDIINRERAEGTLMGVIDDSELAIGLLAYGLHDCGECELEDLLNEPEVTRLVGDIPLGHKTPEDRKEEAGVRQAQYRLSYPDVASHVIERVEAIIAHTDHTALHDLFTGAHDAGTLQVNINAEAALHRLDHLDGGGYPIDEARLTALEGIVGEVRQRSHRDTKRVLWYSHLRELLDKTSRPITRHPITDKNKLYHQHAAKDIYNTPA